MGKFNLNHYQLATADLGQLIPIGLMEVYPGDRFRHSTSLVARMSPMAAPVMHPCQVRIHHFYGPMRLLWNDELTGDGDSNNFSDFITGGADGNNADTVPTQATTSTAKNLEDYLGLPRVSGINVNALPIRLYNMVFNEWYRDQDLVTERALNDVTVAKVAWEKDYFTTARPWEQKGDDVTLPIGTRADVKGIGKTNQTYAGTGANVYETGASGTDAWADYSTADTGGANNLVIEEDPNNAGFPNIYADLSASTGLTVNAFRNALALQRWAEARARWGSRFSEVVRAFGVAPQDGRLDRPEYLGGGTQRMQISEVLQTAPETIVAGTEYGVGDLYGHGIGAARSAPYRHRFPEWGFVLTLMSVRPKAIYANGMHRHWLRQDREDFMWKEFVNLGQQPVYVNEVYADATNGGNTFGYQDRYMELREHPSIITGEFRDTLDYWHLARDFPSEPSLDGTFVTCDPSKRIFQEQTNNSLWCFANHRVQAIRPQLPQRAQPRTF